MIGTRLGPYEITAQLGEGGMGEVYRARDSRLERDVAIKVLPAAFVEDRERLARFDREAKLLAQLNHPNIASIHGLEESGGVRALVMELVDGPTLAERLEGGAFPFEVALPIARQIAEALEEAHEKGIIHRDLKPQNVKVTADGQVKVLDFGLAKAMDPAGAASGAGSASQLAASPTLTLGATQMGVVLGTAAYMSPEQAKGMAVDKRADIWAFGVVLFEMLTRRRLFEGDSVPETLAGVLKSEIDLAALPADVPASIRRLLRRCLERNPKERLHDIADARLVIQDALLPGSENEAAEAAIPVPPAKPSFARLLPLAVLLLAVGAVAGWLAPRSTARASDPAPKLTLRRLTDVPGLEKSPDLSPDGKTLVYSSNASGSAHIYVMRIDGGRAIDITPGTASDDEQPAFSPDGQQIAFRSSRDGGGLFVMGATGESVRRLTDEGFDPAWSPDGRRVAYSTEAVADPYGRGEAALWVVEVATGEKRKLPPKDAVQPAWSPDGLRIAYWANDAGQRDLWTVPADGGEPVAVTHDLPTDWSPEWSPDGRWLYFSSDRAGGLNLFRVPIDPATGGAAGEPEPVTTSAGNLGWARFSSDGKRIVALAYERSAVLELFRLTVGPTPEARPLRTLRPRTLHWCWISPDADWLACSTIGTPEDVMLLRADGSELRRLTADVFKDRNFSWSPDGSRLLFQSTRAGAWAFWSVRVDGSELRQVVDTTSFASEAAWRPDGGRVTFRAGEHELAEVDAARMTLTPDLQKTVLPASMSAFRPTAWSPSGRLLGGIEVDAAQQRRTFCAIDPERGIYLRSRLPVGGNGFRKFGGWLSDSRHFVALGVDQVALVDVETGEFRTLLTLDVAPDTFLSISRDGETLLVERPVEDGDIWLLENSAEKDAGN